ncbi:MAG: SMC-Scp complex subunit ScpB [Ignavibacteriae bacterium HGW-Ignavibacteriae-2]|jgi:segregation and condensation protein B|nr:SMC-Scp complex subunit ScpB [Bacteroidota bacterium]PKL87478.1 MAG: SMC-Scp complex subunit ScpB [Ignavibacteriae bacterium HGW-Ignavibacteriae-2]
MDNIYISIIESLIFASDEPISGSEIVKAIKDIDGEDINISTKDIEDTVDQLNEKYNSTEISYHILRIANGFIHATKPEYAKYVGYLSSVKSKRRLSQAALETLAIIAYKQPITKPEIEQIRGVNSDYMLSTLLEKNLITIKGRSETVGRPLLYVTTEEFLKYFGLNKIEDLPKPREIEEIMKDEDFIEQKRKIMMSEIEGIIEDEVNATIKESGGDDDTIE